jgi:hypothetical protein
VAFIHFIVPIGYYPMAWFSAPRLRKQQLQRIFCVAKMYPGFTPVAENAEFPEIAGRLRAIAGAEEHHGERYKKSFKEVEEDPELRKTGKTAGSAEMRRYP